MPTSSARFRRPEVVLASQRHGQPAVKAGFTLLEMLVVLALIALASGLAFTAAGKALDSNITHTEVYNFQRQLLDLRARAYREDRVYELRDSDDPDSIAAAQRLADRAAGILTDDDGDGEEDDLPSPFPVSFALRDQYSYALSEPVTVTPAGSCTNVTITIIKDAKPVSILNGMSDTDGCDLQRNG